MQRLNALGEAERSKAAKQAEEADEVDGERSDLCTLSWLDHVKGFAGHCTAQAPGSFTAATVKRQRAQLRSEQSKLSTTNAEIKRLGLQRVDEASRRSSHADTAKRMQKLVQVPVQSRFARPHAGVVRNVQCVARHARAHASCCAW